MICPKMSPRRRWRVPVEGCSHRACQRLHIWRSLVPPVWLVQPGSSHLVEVKGQFHPWESRAWEKQDSSYAGCIFRAPLTVGLCCPTSVTEDQILPEAKMSLKSSFPSHFMHVPVPGDESVMCSRYVVRPETRA